MRVVNNSISQSARAKAIEKWYISGIVADSNNWYSFHWAKLFCEKALNNKELLSIRADFEAAEERNKGSHNSARIDFLRSQTVSFYYGHNSFFQCKEDRIYEHIFSGLAIPVNKKYITGSPLDLSSGGSKLVNYMKKTRVNPYLQSWRTYEEFEAKVMALPPKLGDFSKELHGDILVWLCWVEFASRYPDRIDPSVVRLAQTVKKLLTSRKVSAAVRRCYKEANKQCLDEYIENSAAGGELIGCLKFRTEKALNAAIPLLDDNTRYPYVTEESHDIVHGSLLNHRNYSRLSTQILCRLWSSGCQFTHYMTKNRTPRN